MPSQALPLIAAALDAALFVLAGVAGAVCYQLFTTGQIETLDGVAGIGMLSAALFILLARVEGLYQLQALLAPGPYLTRATVVLAVSQLAVTCIFFLLKEGADYSRGAIVVSSAFALATMPIVRVIAGKAFQYGVQRGAIKGRPVVTLGDAVELERLGQSDFLRFGIDEIARIALVGRSIGGGLGQRDRAQIAHAIEVSRQRQAMEFALIMPWGRDRELSEVCGLLRISPLPVRLYPDHKIRSVLLQQKERGLVPHFAVTMQRAPLNGWERALKRVMDIALAALGLVVLAPLLVLTVLFIKLDSRGPILFRQRRCGFDNREFIILKFRTMTVMEDIGPIVQAKQGDARVTRVGRVLRRTSIDELPQLLNVIRGDMSLVGPRPHAMAHDDEYKNRINNYALRHHVKPGLTGAAQVKGLRGETSRLWQMEKRVERDLWYINNWSLALDIKIMAMTCVALFRSNAY
ncbi:MAG TPA: exopolysaccharide biosynthesis polyprenyl glycosylphosphotransferase [Roseiarcus sp.]